MLITHPNQSSIQNAIKFAFQYLSQEELSLRQQLIMNLINSGLIEMEGFFVGVEGDVIVGVLIAQLRLDGLVMIWHPAIADDFTMQPFFAPLHNYAQSHNAPAIMLIADKDQTVDEKTFFDNGFSYISDMLMLVSIASENMKQFDNDFLHNKNYPQLQFIPISETVVKNNKSLETDKKNYREKLLNLICKTYINAKDFPQLLALTSADRLLDEYEQNVFYRPELCFFVRKLQDSNNGNNDIGVLLLIDSPPDQIELTYMGLVEEERGRGYSQELLQFTQKTAIQYGRKLVLTAVDERNTNALRAYIKQGFLTWDRKKIYAKFF